jgi:hypothetical protein
MDFFTAAVHQPAEKKTNKDEANKPFVAIY